MDNTKLINLIRESINEYIREIDEAGNIAALEAKMNKTQEAIELREKKINMDGIDEAYRDMLDKNKIKELGNEIKALKKSLTKYEKQLEKLKNKSEKTTTDVKVEDTEEKEIVDEVSIDETSHDKEYYEDAIKDDKDHIDALKKDENDDKEKLNESFLYMQKLAGIITESEYKDKSKK